MIVFLSNTHDPKDPQADMYAERSFDETYEQAIKNHRDWLKGKIIGLPRKTKWRTVKQLQNMGFVGVYMKVTIWEWFYRLWKGWL